jgi:hypothetical protein
MGVGKFVFWGDDIMVQGSKIENAETIITTTAKIISECLYLAAFVLGSMAILVD